jgi:hypothetical protein
MKMSSFDLDLEKIDKSENDEKGLRVISDEIDQVYRVAPFYQQRLAYNWMQAIHFMLGDQHIFYNQSSRSFEGLPRTRLNKHVPMSVTNLIQPMVSTLVSNLTRNKPNVDVTPN